MKKFLSLVLLMVCVISVCQINTVGATRLKGANVSTLYKYIVFSPDQNTSTTGDNGLNINFSEPIGSYNDGDCCIDAKKENMGNCYWGKAGWFGGYPRIIGVAGYHVTLTNTTDKSMTINWAHSSVTLGDISVAPPVEKPKKSIPEYPLIISDTIVPPHQSITLKLYVPRLYYYQVGNKVVQEFVYLRVDNSLKCELQLKIIDSDGKTFYMHAISPNIILPQSALIGITTSEN